ncbi:MAG: hypothetical protein IJ801_07425 [Lachnospiraceae bacterium]|nr:hypothetical protein [Lachnospiraceae bacterium]
MENRREHHKITYYTYMPALIGVAVGTLFFLIGMEWLDGYWNEQGLEDYKIHAVLNLPLWKIALYVLKRRAGQILLFLLLTILFSYPVTTFGYNLFFGFYYGLVTSSLLVKFGLNGMLYSMVCFFPHYLFYFLALYLIGLWVEPDRLKRRLCYGHVNKLQFVLQIFVIIFLLLFAIFWEIKFQKNFLEKFFQHLV